MAVVIGVDPAKRSHAMAVLDEREEQLAALQVDTTALATGRSSGWLSPDPPSNFGDHLDGVVL
ncbi:MAG: hypothetical protein KY451_11190, partial [Actinobacteria bacterium]|nr:hypothetical protein [Actinomycetota bacterium]